MRPNPALLFLIAAACASQPSPDGQTARPKSISLELQTTVGGIGARLPTLGSVSDLAWADVDGDGTLEIANTLAMNRFSTELETWQLIGGPASLWRTEGGELVEAWDGALSGNAWSAAWADVDLDGDPDLAVGFTSTNVPEDFGEVQDSGAYLYRAPLVLLLNEGGELSPAWMADPLDWRLTFVLRWADVDHDGDPDLAQGAQEGLVLWRNAGDGTLSPETLDGAMRVSDLAWVDRDGDQLPELSVATDDGLWILDNEGGSLELGSEPALLAGEMVHRIAWGDWLGDGRQAPALAGPGGVTWYAVERDEFVVRTAPIQREDEEPFSIAFADFDVDGRLDLAIGWSRGGLDVMSATDSFTGRVLESSWEQRDRLAAVTALAPADWDGDGDADLGVARTDIELSNRDSEDRLSGVYESLTASSEGVRTDVGISVSAWAPGDWDGDGVQELAVTSTDHSGTSPTGDISLVLASSDGPVTQEGGPIFELPNLGTSDFSLDDVVWADWDDDGDTDLGVATGYGPILLDNADGVATIASSDPSRAAATVLAVGDYDGDGDLDYAASGTGLRIFRNDGARWTLAAELGSPDPGGLTWAHLLGDGRLLLVYSADDGLHVLVPPTDDGPWEELDLQGGGLASSVQGILAADADNDGDDEILVPATAASGDQLMDVADGAWVTPFRAAISNVTWDQGAAASDFDNDGVVDFLTGLGLYQHRRGDWVKTIGSSNASSPRTWFDANHDGYPDLVNADIAGNWTWAVNARGSQDLLPTNPPRLQVRWADQPAYPRFAMGSPLRPEDGPVDLILKVSDKESDPVSGLRFEFRDWQGGWRPAAVEGLETALSTAPFEQGGVEYRASWDWIADRADGEAVELRVILDRPTATGEIRMGRIAAHSTPLRIWFDGDDDGIRETGDPCPTDPTNDSLIPGVCDSLTLAQGTWCGTQTGGMTWAPLTLAAGLTALRRRRGGH